MSANERRINQVVQKGLGGNFSKKRTWSFAYLRNERSLWPLIVQKMRINIVGFEDHAVDESEDMEDDQSAIHIGMSTANLCIYLSCILY